MKCKSINVMFADIWFSTTDWLLYSQPDSLPQEQTNNENATNESKRPSNDSIYSPTATPSSSQRDTFAPQPALESHSSPQKRSFAYWPHVLSALLVFQIGAFAVMFSYFRETGLPFLKNWPVVYAIAAPANTCLYATSMVKLAPLRWPVLGKVKVMNWGFWAIDGIWVLWSLGIWWVVRGWGENGA